MSPCIDDFKITINVPKQIPLNGFDSSMEDISFNVRQGSTLGPLFSLLDINGFEFVLLNVVHVSFPILTFMIY